MGRNNQEKPEGEQPRKEELCRAQTIPSNTYLCRNKYPMSIEPFVAHQPISNFQVLTGFRRKTSGAPAWVRLTSQVARAESR